MNIKIFLTLFVFFSPTHIFSEIFDVNILIKKKVYFTINSLMNYFQDLWNSNMIMEK